MSHTFGSLKSYIFRIADPPTFKNVKDEGEILLLQSLIGLPVILNCPQVTGMPVPQIYWHKDENKLVETDNLKIMNAGRLLSIFESSVGDGGIYHCEAHNSAGRCRRSFNVSILGEFKNI